MTIFQSLNKFFIYIILLLLCNGCFLRTSIVGIKDITLSQIPATDGSPNEGTPPPIAPDPNPPVNLKTPSGWSQATTSPALTWEYTTTGNASVLSAYEVCLGTVSNTCDIVGWGNNTLLTQKSFSGLSLSDNTDYYISVRAIDSAGNKSSVVAARFKKVPPVAVNNGSTVSGDWNVRVKKTNHNVVCVGTETQFSDCVHAGEMRSITYLGPSSCAGYTAADELDFFHWTCANGAGHITFKAHWINKGKALKDLITGTSWRSNMIIIKQGGVEKAASTYQSWWGNTIMELPDNPTTTHLSLNSANTIYVINNSKEHGGFKIEANNITVTTLGEATLTLNQVNSNLNCNSNTEVCLIEMKLFGPNKFAWVEGKYAGKGNGTAIKLMSISHLRIENVFISNFNNGIEIDPFGLPYGLIINNYNIAAMNTGILCNAFSGTSSLLISNGVISNVTGYAINETDSCYNLIAIDNYIASSGTGIAMSSASGNFVNNRADHVATPLWIFALDQTYERSTIHHFTATNSNGIYLASNVYLTLSNLMILGSSNPVVTSTTNSNSNFSGKIIFDSATCLTQLDTNPGINTSCAYQAGGPTNATFLQIDPTNWKTSFNGWVHTDDAKNASDNLGFALKSTISDWFNFESIYSFWADNSNLLPIPDKNRCNNCRIWDSKIKSTDLIFKNTTGNGINQNAAFTPGAPCPSWLSGNDTVTDFQPVANTYLRNAKELILDEIGDDDGLCESNESCIALPNWDTYQGSGDYYSQGECLFNNGTVTNIKVYMYPDQN